MFFKEAYDNYIDTLDVLGLDLEQKRDMNRIAIFGIVSSSAILGFATVGIVCAAAKATKLALKFI